MHAVQSKADRVLCLAGGFRITPWAIATAALLSLLSKRAVWCYQLEASDDAQCLLQGRGFGGVVVMVFDNR